MDKEKDLHVGRQGPKFESGFSEKQTDLAVDKAVVNDQVKGGSVFDPKKKNKIKGEVILDSTSQ